MRGILLFSFLALLLAGCARQQQAQAFNGRNFDGWKIHLAESDAPVAEQTFTVQDGFIQASGRPNGYIRTANAFENYRLVVEWRWLGEPGNSGILLHMLPDDKIWPRCIESQLRAGNAGDVILMDGATVREQPDPATRRLPKVQESSESPVGEWNRAEIICAGDTIIIFVNGVEQNRVSGASVRSGHIGLQSEGAPIQFRNIAITPLGD